MPTASATQPAVPLDSECFFIAPIGSEDSPERKRSDGVLEFIVARAAEELGLTAVRADQITEPGQINLQVIEHVLGARAAVVDLTGENPNVFYELAVRHTARLPVALICDKQTKLPFDIAQMRTIFFDHTDLASADLCRKQIVAQLGEALDGAVDSPIATAQDVQILQSGSAVERSLAEVVTTLDELSMMQRTLLDRVDSTVRTRGESVSPAALADMNEALTALDEALLIGDPNSEDLEWSLQMLRKVHRYLERKVGTSSTRPSSRPSRNSRQALRDKIDQELAAPVVEFDTDQESIDTA